MSTHQTFGEGIPDQIGHISKLGDAQLELLHGIRDLYRDRAALEREHGQKLQSLAKKATERWSKHMPPFVVGDEPTKAWDEQTLHRSTLGKAYTSLLASIDQAAQDHVSFSDTLTSQIVDAAKTLAQKQEDVRKKQMQFYQKLLADRDKVYADLTKIKQKYNEECHDVESYRQKQSKAHDDRHAARAAKQFEQQQVDMLTAKNSYLIAITVGNKLKTQFYDDHLPTVENHFQQLQAQFILHVVALLQGAEKLQASHLASLQTHTSDVQETLNEVDAAHDQDIFIEYNARPFTAPADFVFEPCVGYYDTPYMSTEPAPKVFLQNKLSKCRHKLEELVPPMQAKQKDVDRLTKLLSAYASNPKLGDLDEIFVHFLDAHHEVTLFSASECILTAEIDTISAALGGDVGAQQPHNFKSTSFSIPTTCAYCKSSIWGLSKQGKTCKSCGISVHNRCELKVPAECGQVHSNKPVGQLPKDEASCESTAASSDTTPSAFWRHDMSVDDIHHVAQVLYDYAPTSPFELAVTEGAQVQVLEDDDGSGWVKIADEHGKRGLIPASYIEIIDNEEETTHGVSHPSQSQGSGSGEFVTGVYSYLAQNNDELDVHVGQRIELTSGPSGGVNYANEWWQGLDERGKTGIFPSNYVKLA